MKKVDSFRRMKDTLKVEPLHVGSLYINDSNAKRCAQKRPQKLCTKKLKKSRKMKMLKKLKIFKKDKEEKHPKQCKGKWETSQSLRKYSF